MRIDLNHGLQTAPESARSGSQNSGTSGSSSTSHMLGSVLGEDQAQLSGAHVQVAALAAQVSQLPEVRQEKVQVLRQAIQSGRYTASPDQVAGAVFAHMIAGSAA
jgi:flagellar biosynthesis anti-sigma factor FlgM